MIPPSCAPTIFLMITCAQIFIPSDTNRRINPRPINAGKYIPTGDASLNSFAIILASEFHC